jgi:large subunit ribosomal protein L19e
MSGLQKRLAASILKVGESKVWLDPSKIKDIEKAITRIDIKKLIKQGAIKALPGKLRKPREMKKSRKGIGSRKGAKYSIFKRKERWISTVRPLRKMLKELRTSQQIENVTYKKLYKLVKGGVFRSRSHLKVYLEQHNLLKKK